MQTNIVVSIGRCVGSEPMDAGRWQAFKERVQTLLVARSELLMRPSMRSLGVEEDTQHGVWQGVASEGTAVWMATIDRVNIPGLRNALAVTAYSFNQDAIGLIVNETGTNSVVDARSFDGDI